MLVIYKWKKDLRPLESLTYYEKFFTNELITKV